METVQQNGCFTLFLVYILFSLSKGDQILFSNILLPLQTIEKEEGQIYINDMVFLCDLVATPVLI